MNIWESNYDLTSIGLNADSVEAGDVYLMCSKCYSIYRANISHVTKFNIVTKDKELIADGTQIRERLIIIDCPNCHTFNIDAIELDVNIAECVSILNKKGYYTKYSCEGEHSSAYIMMNKIYPEIKELVKRSSYWKLDNNYSKNMTIRCSSMIQDRSIYNNMLHIAELYDLVQKLPDKSSIEKEKTINE
jgi:hypothetical protein